MSYLLSDGDSGIFIFFFFLILKFYLFIYFGGIFISFVFCPFPFFSLFYKLKYNIVLVYNIMLGVQQSDLYIYIYIYIFFFRIFSLIDPFVFSMICLTVNLYNLLFPWWLRGYKASACNVGNSGLIPGLGRSPGEGNGNPLQYSCLENPTDGGAW